MLAGVIDSFLGEYLSTVHKVPFVPPRDIGDRILEIIQSGSLNRAATPGYPFIGIATVGEVIDFNLQELLLYVEHFIHVLSDYSPEQFNRLSFDEWKTLGIMLPHRVMVKQEPHKVAKLYQKRPRGIFAESLVAQLAFRFVFTPLVNDAIAHHRERYNKTGMGLHDAGLADLFSYAHEAYSTKDDGTDVVSDDIGGWDTEVSKPLLSAGAILMHHQLDLEPGSLWSNLYWNLLSWETNSPIALSDGRLVSFLEWHGQRSGSFITAYRNGEQRRLLSIAVNVYSGKRYTPGGKNWTMHMGDDSVNSIPSGIDIVASYAALGFTLTDLRVFDGQSFEFCSTIIRRQPDGKIVGEPQKWAATLMRLLSHPYDEMLHAQWRYEMRGCPLIQRLDDFLLWSGWRPKVTHHARLPTMQSSGCVLPGPQNMTKKKASSANPTKPAAEKKSKQSRRHSPTEYTALVSDSDNLQRFADAKRNANQVALLPPMRSNGAKVAHPVSEMRKELMAPLAPRLRSYFDSLARPWDTAVKCPVNFNPVPSYLTSLARVTASATLAVTSNTSTQIDLFPGHAGTGDEMDGVAYHSHSQAWGGAGTVSVVGPVGDGTRSAAIGFYTTGLPITAAATSSNVATCNPLVPATALPYVARDNDPAHTRWKLVSMGIRIENITSIQTRGGIVRWCQPSSEFVANTVAAHEVFETYDESSKANTGTLEITWVPRPADVAFWHSSNAANFSDMVGTGIRIWLTNADAANPQAYRIFVVQNYEMAGSNLESIASRSVIQPADQDVLSTTLSVLRTTESTAGAAPAVAKAVAHSASPLALPDTLMAGLTKGMSTALKGAVAALF